MGAPACGRKARPRAERQGHPGHRARRVGPVPADRRSARPVTDRRWPAPNPTRPTLVQPIIGLVVQSFEPAAVAKGITVDTHLDPVIGPIAVDPDRLQQIAWHLLSNAIKFTPPDGRVTITLALRDITSRYRGRYGRRLHGRHRVVTVRALPSGRQQQHAARTEASGWALASCAIWWRCTAGRCLLAAKDPIAAPRSKCVLPQRAAAELAARATSGRTAAACCEGVSVLVVDDDAARSSSRGCPRTVRRLRCTPPRRRRRPGDGFSESRPMSCSAICACPGRTASN